MSRSMFQRILCAVMICVLCISTSAFPAVAATYNSKDEIQDQIDNKESQKDQSQQTEEQFKKELDELQEEMDVINNKLSTLNSQIREKTQVVEQYQSEIKGLQTEIDAATQKQTDLENEISGTYELLSERLCAAYMAGETSTLEILLSADDFETFLTRLELVKRISEHDTALVADLQADINELNATKEKLTSDRAAVEEKQAAAQSELDAIEADRAEVLKAKSLQTSKQNAIEQKLSKQEQYTNSLDKDIQFLQEEMNKYDEQKSQGMNSGSGSIENSGTSNYPVSSKGMICPLQYPNVVISAGWYGYANHQGIDFTTAGATGNTYGKEIRAAADGVVYSAEYHYSWGNNVYINHGNGVYTRYAHCSQLLVSAGQTVKQGQVIAYVGNTGNVYPRPTDSNPHAGAHLHFEVWVNGTRVNPAPWLP